MTGAVLVLGEEWDTQPSPGQPVLRLRPEFKTGSGRNAIYPHFYRMSSWFGEEQGHWGQLSPVKEGKPRGLILKVCRGEACPCVRRAALHRQFVIKDWLISVLERRGTLTNAPSWVTQEAFRSASSQHHPTSPSFRFDIALWKPRRCLTFICLGTGPDTSLVIQDEKITHSRTSVSRQTLRKKKPQTFTSIKMKVLKIACALYLCAKLLLQLQSAKLDVQDQYLRRFLAQLRIKHRLSFNICLQSTKTLLTVRGDLFSSPDMWPLGQQTVAPCQRTLQQLRERVRYKSRFRVYVVNRRLHRWC